MMGLTPQQAACLRAIKDLSRDGIAPSYEELREHLHLANRSGVARLVTALKDRGAIDFEPNRSRTIRVIERPPELARMSLSELRRLSAEIEAEISVRIQGRGH
jgi:repressor LexA